MYDPEQTLCVMVVDAVDLIHWGLRPLLGSEPWVDAYVTAHEPDRAVSLARRYEPELALVDLALGSESGLDVCASLRSACPATRVLLMSPLGGLSSRSARAVGASGVVSRDASAGDVVRAARMVSLGMTLFSGPERSVPHVLTPREHEVLTLIAAGSTNAEIAKRLQMAENTVKQHVSSVYRKLDARSRVEAIRRAQAAGIFD